jgi:hypothetical protein
MATLRIRTLKLPIFEIVDGDRHYKIYDSGTVEGCVSDKARTYNYTGRLIDHVLACSAESNGDLQAALVHASAGGFQEEIDRIKGLISSQAETQSL